MKEIFAKIKCWFGKCAEIQEIKIKEKLAVDKTYKVEPIVRTVEPKKKSTPANNVITESPLEEDKKPSKPKRAWFNNGKEQKLIPIDTKINKVRKGWVKGKLPKTKLKEEK